MTDLINNVNNLKTSDLDDLYKKYGFVLEIINEKEKLPYIAYLINISHNKINEKYENLASNWKSWSVFVVKKLFLFEKIKTDDDVYQIIDDFVSFYEKKYDDYTKTIEFSLSEFDKEIVFVKDFIKTYSN